MHNPLALLSPRLLDEFINRSYRYFVRQQYPRGYTVDIKEAFIVTQYKEVSHATAHFGAISWDMRRHLYDIAFPDAKQRLYVAARQPDGYRVYVPLIRDKVWKPPFDLVSRINNYLRSQGKRALSASSAVMLNVKYGRVVVDIHIGVEVVAVSLDELERL